jgi:hypothetical protein
MQVDDGERRAAMKLKQPSRKQWIFQDPTKPLNNIIPILLLLLFWTE